MCGPRQLLRTIYQLCIYLRRLTQQLDQIGFVASLVALYLLTKESNFYICQELYKELRYQNANIDPLTKHPLTLPRAGLKNGTLGIVGAGRIGQSIARKVVPFGIKRLLYYGRTEKDEMKALGAELHRSLEFIARECDYIILSLPHTKETHHIFNEEIISLMKPTAILVNVGRGGLIDQDALVRALKDKRIGGAALDVTTPEPLPPKHPLFELDNVLLTPHIATDTVQVHNDIAALMVRNSVAALNNEPMEDEVIL